MMKFRDKKGFSLVELMIVVAIIAILAAIAIPSFLRFAMRSKTSEATSNLAGIRTGEEGYRAEHDVYLIAGPYPAAQPSATGVLWEDLSLATPVEENTGFKSIGFAADGLVRYQYQATVNAAAGTLPPNFTATATGDLDDDTAMAMYQVSNDPAEVAGTTLLINAAGAGAYNVYPKAILVKDVAGVYDDF